MENRKNQIKESLLGLGTEKGKLYTNQEVIDLLKELQDALAKNVFEKIHAENLRSRDILIHFEALAKEYNLDSTEPFLRLKKNMGDLGYTIGTYIKGSQGERVARHGLMLLSHDQNVKILYNIGLQNELAKTEYDAIVLAPYGIFVLEVKNWASSVTVRADGLLEQNEDANVVYDMVGRLSDKEALLKECLKDYDSKEIQCLMIFPNEHAVVKDEYHRIPIIRGSGVSYAIRGFNSGKNLFSAEDIENIEKTIVENSTIQKDYSPVDCDAIIEDFSDLMAKIENASLHYDEQNNCGNAISETVVKEVVQSPLKKDARIKFKDAIRAYYMGIASITFGAIGAIAAYSFAKKTNSSLEK